MVTREPEDRAAGRPLLTLNGVLAILREHEHGSEFDRVRALVDYAMAQRAAALAAPPPDETRDGSVMVRVDPSYVEQMRRGGLEGPFARIELDESGSEPRLMLTVAQEPTPDSVDWWRSVAAGLGVEIQKLKDLASARESEALPDPIHRRIVELEAELAALKAQAPPPDPPGLLSRGQARAIHVMTNVAHARNGRVLSACDGPDCPICADLTLLKLPRALSRLAAQAPPPAPPGLLQVAKDYIELLESSQDGYYRAMESDESEAWHAALAALPATDPQEAHGTRIGESATHMLRWQPDRFGCSCGATCPNKTLETAQRWFVAHTAADPQAKDPR